MRACRGCHAFSKDVLAKQPEMVQQLHGPLLIDSSRRVRAALGRTRSRTRAARDVKRAGSTSRYNVQIESPQSHL
jgi:hypothetical protein